MAKLEILQCASCGSPLSPGALTCEYCGVQNVIKSKQNPLKISSEMARKYIAFYGEKTKENPKDTNALYSMGLLYLSLKNYELAQRNFKDAIDQSPLDADVYYYYTLALVAGKSIRAMNGKEVARVEEYLGTALGMEIKCKYLALLAVIKQDYYIENNMVVQGKDPQQLFEEASEYSPDDLDEINEHCNIRSNSAQNIEMLLGKKVRTRKTQDNDQSQKSSMSEEEINEALNLSNRKREDYYEYDYEPAKPGWGEKTKEYVRYEKTPKFIGFTLKRAWKFLLNAVIFVVLVTIGQCSGLGIKDVITTDSIDQRIEYKVKNAEEKYDKTYTPEELKESRGEFVVDSINYIKKYEALKENPDMKKLISFPNADDGTTQHYFVKMTFWGLFALLVIFSPLLIWLIVTIAGLISEINKYKDAKRYNRRLDDNYKYAMECYNTKPTWDQMEVFINDFLKNYVDSELEYHKKFEEDFRGVTLFVNRYYDFEEQDEEGEEDAYFESYVKLTTVLLEEDCATIMRSNWRVYEDNQSVGTFEQISYGDIGSVALNSNGLFFGGVSIEIPEDQIFEYQNTNPSDKMTYSTTRTSDVRTFAVALRKLVQDYKNR